MRNDYIENNLDTVTSKMMLLWRILITWNRNSPENIHLTPVNLTLKQSSYDEDEKIKVSDDICRQYNAKRRHTKPPPRTRKRLMEYIFHLALELFGKRFMLKRRTHNAVKPDKGTVYNYETNHAVIQLVVDLWDWSATDLRDLDSTLIDRYDIKSRKQEALRDWHDVTQMEWHRIRVKESRAMQCHMQEEREKKREDIRKRGQRIIALQSFFAQAQDNYTPVQGEIYATAKRGTGREQTGPNSKRKTEQSSDNKKIKSCNGALRSSELSRQNAIGMKKENTLLAANMRRWLK